MMTRCSVLILVYSLLVAVAPCQAAPASQQSAAKTYRGTVVDERGEPLAGVAVCVVPPEPTWLPEPLLAACKVRTDESGRFELSVSERARTAMFVARGRTRVMQSLKLLSLWPVQMSKAGALAGQVRGADGKPIDGARIIAEDHMRGLAFVQDHDEGNTQARLHSVTASDARGRFILRGVYDTAVRLTVTALGFHDLEVGPVSKLEPLRIELKEASGILTGVVLQADGKPAAGASVRSYQTQGTRKSTFATSDGDGRFACTWYGGQTRVTASVTADGVRSLATENLAELAPCELRLQPIKSRTAGPSSVSLLKPEQSVRVTATGPDGKACDAFRAAVFRFAPDQQKYRTDIRQLGAFDDCAVAASDGAAVAPVYRTSGESGWLVLASADGCAMARQEVDVDTEEVKIQFAAAAPVRGQVMDARSGKPVAGVRVWFLSDLDGGPLYYGAFKELDGEAFSVRSGIDGSFVLGDAPIAKGRLFFSKAGYDTVALPCEVGAEGKARMVVLEPRGPLPGQLEADPIPDSLVALRSLRKLPGGDSRQFADLAGAVPVDSNGAFQMLEQSVGERHFEALVQRLPRQGRPDKVIVGKQVLDHDTKRITLDAALAIPLRVRGKVTGDVPFQRLAVLCAPLPTGSMHYGYLQYRGPLCPLAIDGTYDLQTVPSKRVLCVIDVVSGVLFARFDIDLSDGSDRQQDFRIKGHEVTVRLEASDEVRAAQDFFLEYVPCQELWPGGVAQISPARAQLDTYCKGMGIPIPATSSEAKLWLPQPAGQIALRRYSRYSGARAGGAAHAVQGIDPQKDRAVTLTW